jgi:hypothetical protein
MWICEGGSVNTENDVRMGTSGLKGVSGLGRHIVLTEQDRFSDILPGEFER